jgi:hypothetical protein
MAFIFSSLYAAQTRASASADFFNQNDKHLYVEFTLAAPEVAGQHTIVLGRIPYKSFRVHPQLSIFGCSAMTATAQIHLGYRYLHPTTRVAIGDDNFWLDNVVATAAVTADLMGDIAGVVPAGLVPASNVFETLDGMLIDCMIDTANIRLGDTITLDMAYSQLG